MQNFVEIFQNLVVQSLNQVYNFTIQYGPGILFALAIILLGWMSAIIVKKIVSKLLKALGFDVLSEKIGFKRLLERGDIERAPSALIGLIFYWAILLNALIMASDAIDLNITSRFIQQTILYIPKIAVVIIFLALAIFIGKFIYNLVEKGAHAANIPLYRILGNIARYATIGLAIMMILEYLEVNVAATTQVFVIIFVIVPIAFFLAFMIGGKELISCLIARRYLVRELKKGDSITFDNVSGEIEEIDFIATKLKRGNEEIIVPNSELANKIIRKKVS